jgi:hypothetical protein
VVGDKSSASQIQVISEDPNEDVDFKEEDYLEEIKQIEQKQGVKGELEEEKEDQKYAVKRDIKALDMNISNCTKHKAICHTWFIVKDKGMEINWEKPLVQKS